MDSRQRSAPAGATVRGIFSHGPAPSPQAGSCGTSAEAPFPLPRALSVWGGLLLTSAPLSCLSLHYNEIPENVNKIFPFSRESAAFPWTVAWVCDMIAQTTRHAVEGAMSVMPHINPNDPTSKSSYVLVCERVWLYHTLTFVAGFWGAFTYLLRGNVFCNAQTGNVVLMGMALGGGQWRHALYYLIPISAYIAGSFFSDLLPNPVKHRLPIRWETLLIAVEIVVVLLLGLLPETAPVQISQVAINFIASMQYNTFRQADGVAMSTTFATNYIRQIGIGLAAELRHRHRAEKSHRKKLAAYFQMLLFFFGGTVAGSVASHALAGRAMLLTALPLGFLFAVLLRADLTTEKDLLERKPAGH